MKIRQIVTILAILALIAICVQPIAAENTVAPEPTPTPDKATNFFNMGERSLSNGNYQEALDYFGQAFASNTTNMALGDSMMFMYKDSTGALTDLGRYDEAIATADEGIALYKKSPGLWNNKGYAYYKMGKYAEAIAAYNNATRIDPSYLTGYLNKGNALVKAGRGSEAVDAYTKALELDPGNPVATAGLPDARKLADQANLIIVALIAVVVIAAGLIIWYVKFRKTDDEKAPGKAKSKK